MSGDDFEHAPGTFGGYWNPSNHARAQAEKQRAANEVARAKRYQREKAVTAGGLVLSVGAAAAAGLVATSESSDGVSAASPDGGVPAVRQEHLASQNSIAVEFTDAGAISALRALVAERDSNPWFSQYVDTITADIEGEEAALAALAVHLDLYHPNDAVRRSAAPGRNNHPKLVVEGSTVQLVYFDESGVETGRDVLVSEDTAVARTGYRGAFTNA